MAAELDGSAARPSADAGLDTGTLRGKKIALITTFFAPDNTGIAPYAADTVKMFTEAGATVQVVTPFSHYPHWSLNKRDSRTFRRLVRDGDVEILRHWIAVPAKQSLIRRGLYELSQLAIGATWLRRLEADLVYCIVPNVANGALARAAAARLKVPRIVHVQDLSAAGAVQSGFGGAEMIAGLIAKLEMSAISGASACIVASDAFRSHIAEHSPQLIRNWSPALEPATAAEITAQRERLGWAPDDRVLLHLGNLGRKQAVAEAVSKIGPILAGQPNLRLAIIGDGSEVDEVKQAADQWQNVTYHPPVPESELAATVEAADFALLSERASVDDMSLPSKLSLYAAAGLPVISFAAPDGAASEFVAQHGIGRIVPRDQPKLVFETLAKWCHNPDEVDTIAENGRSLATERLGRSLAKDQIVGVVAALLNDAEGQPC